MFHVTTLRWTQRGENTWAAHPYRIYANWDGLYRLYETGRFAAKFERLREAQRAAERAMAEGSGMADLWLVPA